MPALSLKARALQWLAQRDHSRSELRGKLLRLAAAARRAGSPPDDDDPAARAAEVDALLDELQRQGWLDERRFVESRVNTRAPRFGNVRIRSELSRLGVSLDADADAALRASEVERARAVWARKYQARAPADAAERARQMRFLAGRGFSAEVIRRVVPTLGADDD
ncbi:MAG: regulatory protein RecX [Gammaproteobacteria bacterium]|uniref:regulatory protein RecX n=1 Tax=Azohydromonas sp. TaxID=1872666 RepID=UPI002C327C68|nr:regulatory protein RecX [Azohydromonas sp.]HMM84945.1 regulatory protein RecX [Azohydromonas sp.]